MEKLKFYVITIVIICVVACCKSPNKNTSIKETNVIETSVLKSNVKECLLRNDKNDKVNVIKIKEEENRKNIILLGSYCEDYYSNDNFKLINFIEKVDSSIYKNQKQEYSSLFDSADSFTKKGSNLIILPTDYGYVELKIKSEDENPYEVERYEYLGSWNNISAYLLFQSKGEGSGYRMVYKTKENDFISSGYPYVSLDKSKCVTCRVDAENTVLGTIEFFGLDLDGAEPKWGGWSDYSLLPIEAVWESDTTVLLKAEQYLSENDYYEQKLNNYIYGRLTIRN